MRNTAIESVAKGSLSPRSTDLAYEQIKERILDNLFPPGAQILEQDIAAELELSRTPVREALVRLQQDGLLQIVPRHGVRISAVSSSDMREIYEVLLSLEPTAVELLARKRPSKKELAFLIEACDAMESALAKPNPDLKSWAKADESFHSHLAHLCGNRRLANMIMTVWEQSHRARMFTLHLRPLPKKSTREHREVLNAIIAGDVNKARKLYEDHRRHSGDELINILERYGYQKL